jgi:hypothetical protein
VSISQFPRPTEAAVHLSGDTIHVQSLAITHPEAAALAREHVAAHGADSLADLVRTALPIGLVALTLGGKGMNTASLQRTFDHLGDQVSAATTVALASLESTTTALRAGEQDLANRAQRVLERLPERVEVALAGASGSVRSQVTAAVAETQAVGLAEIRNALSTHSEAVRNALSLDHEGPVKALREEVLRVVDGTRQELGGQLTVVQGLLIAAQSAATTTASVKTTRAIGLQFEAAAMQMADEVVTSAGDLFDATGSRPAPGGGTSRAGDGVATLSSLITGSGRTVRVCFESKTRERPLTTVKWREELAASRDLRQAVGGLGIVPDASQIPGGGGRLFARVGERLFVVVADPQIMTLCYLVLRELCALASGEHADSDEVDLAKAEARISQALAALNDLDLVTRHAAAATSSLEKIREVTAGVKTRVEDTLKDSLAALNRA